MAVHIVILLFFLFVHYFHVLFLYGYCFWFIYLHLSTTFTSFPFSHFLCMQPLEARDMQCRLFGSRSDLVSATTVSDSSGIKKNFVKLIQLCYELLCIFVRIISIGSLASSITRVKAKNLAY